MADCYSQMDRDIPAFNQLVVNKINQKNQQLHEQRLQNIRSSQNSRAYLATSLNGRQNRKAAQLEEDKKTEIERHNLMLFNKMKSIMNRPDPHNRRTAPDPPNPRAATRTSLELARIQEQNRTMYERIERQRPTISNKKLFEERQKHLNILKFLGKYSAHSIHNATVQNIRTSQTATRPTLPDPRKKAHTAKPQHYLEDEEEEYSRYGNAQYDDEVVEEDFNRMQAVIEAKRHKHAQQMREKRRQDEEAEARAQREEEVQQQQQQRMAMGERPSVPRSAKEITLYRTSKEVSGCPCEVRILRKHLTYEIRCTPTGGLEQQPLRVELSEEEGTRLLEDTNYDYAAIIAQLTIARGTLLLSPKLPQTQSAEIQAQRDEEDLMAKIHNKRKNQFPVNASHISEQNEEDSYQYELREKPTNTHNHNDINELDSLGEEEQFEKYTTEELSESQNHLDFRPPANFEHKLQQLKHAHAQQQEQLQPADKYEIEIQNESQGPTEEPQASYEEPRGSYEEALDEEIE